MKITVEIYRDYDHTSRKEFSVDASPALLNKILDGIVLGDIIGDLTSAPVQSEEKE